MLIHAHKINIFPSRLVFQEKRNSQPPQAGEQLRQREAVQQQVEAILKDPKQYQNKVEAALALINVQLQMNKGGGNRQKLQELGKIQKDLQGKLQIINTLTQSRTPQEYYARLEKARTALTTQIQNERGDIATFLAREIQDPYTRQLLEGVMASAPAVMPQNAPAAQPAAAPQRAPAGQPAAAPGAAPAAPGQLQAAPPEASPNLKGTVLAVMQAWPPEQVNGLKILMSKAVDFLDDNMVNTLAQQNMGVLAMVAGLWSPSQKRQTMKDMINQKTTLPDLINLVSQVDNTQFESALNQSLARSDIYNMVSDPNVMMSIQNAGRDVIGRSDGMALGRGMWQTIDQWPDQEISELRGYLATSVNFFPEQTIKELIDRYHSEMIDQKYGEVSGWFMDAGFDIATFFGAEPVSVPEARRMIQQKIANMSKDTMKKYLNQFSAIGIKNMLTGMLNQPPQVLSSAVGNMMMIPGRPGEPPRANPNAPKAALRVTQTILRNLRPDIRQ